jgi:hypothetical protein
VRNGGAIVKGAIADLVDGVALRAMSARMSAFLCGRRLGKNGTSGQAKIAAHHYEEPWESAKRFLHRLICLSFGSSLDGQCREGVALGDDGCLTILRAGRAVLLVPDELDSLEAHRIVVACKDSWEARRAVRRSHTFQLLPIADPIMALNHPPEHLDNVQARLSMGRQLRCREVWGRQSRTRAAIDEDGDSAVGEHLQRLTAEHDRRKSAPAM